MSLFPVSQRSAISWEFYRKRDLENKGWHFTKPRWWLLQLFSAGESCQILSMGKRGKASRRKKKAEKSFWCMRSQQNTPSITEFKNELTQVPRVKKKAVSLVVLAQELPWGPGETCSSAITRGHVKGNRQCITLQCHPARTSTVKDTASTQKDSVGLFSKFWMKLPLGKFWAAHQPCRLLGAAC